MSSLGSQKNFRAFVIKRRNGPLQIPDKSYFKLLVAKAILFKTIDEIIRNWTSVPIEDTM